LPHRPSHEIHVESAEGGIQRGLVESPVIGGPVRNAGIYEGDNFGEGHVAAPVNAPAPDLMTDTDQRLPADRGRETDEEAAVPAPGQRERAYNTRTFLAVDGSKV